MSCKECGCKKSPEQSTLVEDTRNLSLSERSPSECKCSGKNTAKSCRSGGCASSRPNRGCSCCCRSCCACCRCCSRSTGDFCQERGSEMEARTCSGCNTKKEEEVTSPGCACSKSN